MIDVLIPVYNNVRTLPELIRSLEAQSFSDFRVVFVDDASTDGSLALLEETVSRHPDWVLSVHSVNQGSGSARNDALRLAKSEYVFFADADDKLDSSCLQTLWRVMDEAKVDIVSVDYTMNEKELGDGTGTTKAIRSRSFLRQLYRRDDTCYFWGRLYRREVLEGIRFRSLPLSEDLIFLTELCSRIKLHLLFVRYKGYYYRPNPQGLIRSYDAEKYFSSIRQMEECWLSERFPLSKGYLVNRILSLLRGLIRHSDESVAEKAIAFSKKYIRYPFFFPLHVSMKNRIFFLYSFLFRKR